MNNSTLEQRIGKLILIILNMNRNIIDIHTALQQVANAVEDVDTKTEILQHIKESQDKMSVTLEKLDEYFKLTEMS